MKKIVVIFCISAAILELTSCGGGLGKNLGEVTYPFTIDVSKNYPMEPASLQDILGKMEYVRLETRPECLVGRLENPTVTDNDIFVLSNRKAVFRFDRSGKFRNRIGNEGRGPDEYVSATRLCVNDREEEVFIYDVLSDVIQVYDYEGSHKRTLRMDARTRVKDMIVISKSTLLISNLTSDATRGYVTYPYQLISSHDGSVIKSLLLPDTGRKAHIPVPENLPKPERGSTFRPYLDESYKPFGIRVSRMFNEDIGWIEEDYNIYVTEDGVMLTSFVADSVYVVSESGELTPRWIKTPSPMKIDNVSKRRYSKFEFETDRHAFFSAAGNGDSAGYMVDKSTGVISRTYLYDINMEHRDFPYNKIVFHTGVNTGHFAISHEAFMLLEFLEMGKLSGPLADIASTIKEDDNPVLMLVK